MRIIVKFWLVIFLPVLLILCSGCDCRNVGSGVVINPSNGGGEFHNSARQAEDFLRVMESLNSLEGSPCLPDTQGAEKIIQSGDRLNSWIQHRRKDESWKHEPEFLEIESIVQKSVTCTDKVVKLLNILQGKEVLDENKQPLKTSDNLTTERQEIINQLTELESIFNSLNKHVNLTEIQGIASLITDLKGRFNALNAIQNLNTVAINAFTKRLESETEQLALIAAHFHNLTKNLQTNDLFIQTSDIYYLIQCIWIRDIANWARGDQQDILERVKNLFDWTICNIEVKNQIRPNTPSPLQLPWQTILLGNSTELDRTWVFIELLRQQRIDAALLAVEDPSGNKSQLVWGVGVLIENEIYVFVPEYGTPLPTKDGLTFDENGTLICKNIATLSQLLNDDSLLRQLDISESKKFPITSDMLKKSKLLLAASPETVSMRMKVLESELIGDLNTILYSNISEQKRQFAKAKSIDNIEINIWKHPFRTKIHQLFHYPTIANALNIFIITKPFEKRLNFPLWSGRILYFKGNITGQDGSMTNYQNARISDREIMEYRTNPEFRNRQDLIRILQLATNQAVFWSGIASFERDSIDSAKDIIGSLTSKQINLWTTPEEYILGRIAEREKNYKEAINHYKKIPPNPTSEIRIKFLQEKTSQ